MNTVRPIYACYSRGYFFCFPCEHNVSFCRSHIHDIGDVLLAYSHRYNRSVNFRVF